MSRAPFTPMTGCPPISADINILHSMPMCTLPTFSSPTCAIRLPEVAIPDLAPPDPCQELNFIISGGVQLLDPPLRSGPQLKLTLGLHPQPRELPDPCTDPYKLSFKLELPCLPDFIPDVSNITILPPGGPGFFSGAVKLIHASCKLHAEFDVRIKFPKVNFSGISALSGITGPIGPTGPSGAGFNLPSGIPGQFLQLVTNVPKTVRWADESGGGGGPYTFWCTQVGATVSVRHGWFRVGNNTPVHTPGAQVSLSGSVCTIFAWIRRDLSASGIDSMAGAPQSDTVTIRVPLTIYTYGPDTGYVLTDITHICDVILDNPIR